MQLSPQDRQDVLKMVANRIVDELRADAGGDLSEIVLLPLGTVAHLVQVSTKQLQLLLPVTTIGPNSRGVTLRNLRNHIEKNTTRPGN